MHRAAKLLGSLVGQIDSMILVHHYSNFHHYSDLVIPAYEYECVKIVVAATKRLP